MTGVDLDAKSRADTVATARPSVDSTVDQSVPGSFRELRGLTAGALLPISLSNAGLDRCMTALRLLLQRCEAEYMRRQGYGRRRNRPAPPNANGPRPDRREP